MPNYASPRYRRIFSQLQTGGFRSVNNTTGTWTSTGAQYIRASENAVKLSPAMPKTDVPILTGTRSLPPQILGRKSATWELNDVPVVPSAAAGTTWDLDTLFQNIFGQPGTIVASTSVTYSFLDSGYLPLTLLDFMHGVSTLQQRLVWGAFVQECTFKFNQSIFTVSFKGVGGYRLDSKNFTNEDSIGKAGLTAYPTEPGSVSFLGNAEPGFYATASWDGGAVATEIRSLEVKIQTGYRLVADVLADAYPVMVVGGPRRITTTVGFLDSDLAALTDLKQKAKQNTAINCSIVIGPGANTTPVAGQQTTFNLNQVQLVTEDYEDQTDIVMANFPESTAHATALTNTDDCTIVQS